MLEPMAAFFEKRLDTYDWHMLNEIESAGEFYPFTADLLPHHAGARVLDLGCGTGLELEFYFAQNPKACITGIDLSRGMLDALAAKFAERDVTLWCGSYFDLPFGERAFDAAVSVESLHHFTAAQKLPLYQKLRAALTDGGYLILTDYFAASDAEEHTLRQNLLSLKAAQGISDDAFYHYDTPLTVAHETEALLEAGFASVEVLAQWGNTYCLRAQKSTTRKTT